MRSGEEGWLIGLGRGGHRRDPRLQKWDDRRRSVFKGDWGHARGVVAEEALQKHRFVRRAGNKDAGANNAKIPRDKFAVNQSLVPQCGDNTGIEKSAGKSARPMANRAMDIEIGTDAEFDRCSGIVQRGQRRGGRRGNLRSEPAALHPIVALLLRQLPRVQWKNESADNTIQVQLLLRSG